METVNSYLKTRHLISVDLSNTHVYIYGNYIQCLTQNMNNLVSHELLSSSATYQFLSHYDVFSLFFRARVKITTFLEFIMRSMEFIRVVQIEMCNNTQEQKEDEKDETLLHLKSFHDFV